MVEKSIGKKLKQTRVFEAKITISLLAQKVGYSSSCISAIENGRFTPSKKLLEKIQTVFEQIKKSPSQQSEDHHEGE